MVRQGDKNRLEWLPVLVAEWLGMFRPGLWRWLAILLFSGLSAMLLWRGSLLVNGTRYFWLDDDQMISMRYARNLVEGYGLVFNPGQRVEGYSNFLWVLLMALFHWLPVGDGLMAVTVKVVNWGLGCLILGLADRLLLVWLEKPGLLRPVLLFSLALCVDLLYWSSNGFETTLLTCLFLAVVVRLLQPQTGRGQALTFGLLALIPLVRGDGLQVWAGAALLAMGLASGRVARRRVFGLLALSLIPTALHFLFRYGYYGQWLPNTYYLKVAGLPGKFGLGWDYLTRFANYYLPWLLMAGMGLLVSLDRRRWLLAGGILVTAGYILLVGGDTFRYARFLAHWLPVLFVLALVTIGQATGRDSFPRLLLLLFVLYAAWYPAGNHQPYRNLLSFNGSPLLTIPTAILIRDNTPAQTSVALFAAGHLPYFSHRPTIDLLGKTDSQIAHLPPHPRWQGPSWHGHNKFDIAYSLGLQPDLVVPMFPAETVLSESWPAEQLATVGQVWWGMALLIDPTFRANYVPHPLNVPYLLEHGAVYARPNFPLPAAWPNPAVRFDH